MGRGWESFKVRVRKSLDRVQEMVGRSLKFKGDSDEASGEIEGPGNQREGDPCCKVATNLPKLCSSFPVSDEPRYLAEVVTQCVILWTKEPFNF